MRAIPGVHDVRSDITYGCAQISIDFGWGRNMVVSTLLVNSAIASAVPLLPAGTTYDVRWRDLTVFPILSYSLISERQLPVAVRDLARYQMTPLLSAIS